MANTPDFSYISMTNPPIPFLGSKWRKKGFLEHFCCWQYQFPDQEIRVFFAFFEAKITKIVILDQKLIVTNDYQQFCVHFELFYHFFKFWM